MSKSAAMYAPIPKGKLSENVAKRIKQDILNNTLPPGARLPSERQLAEQFMANRATIREALQHLAMLDLVEVLHGRGIYVKDFRESKNLELAKELLLIDGSLDIRTMLDLLDLRGTLLPEVAAWAASRRNESDLERLKQAVHEASLQPNAGNDALVHQSIARASGNFLFTIVLNAFSDFSTEHADLYFSIDENREKSKQFYADIYQAIERGDTQLAREVMSAVLSYAFTFAKEAHEDECKNVS